jgi:hypothetical protein
MLVTSFERLRVLKRCTLPTNHPQKRPEANHAFVDIDISGPREPGNLLAHGRFVLVYFCAPFSLRCSTMFSLCETVMSVASRTGPRRHLWHRERGNPAPLIKRFRQKKAARMFRQMRTALYAKNRNGALVTSCSRVGEEAGPV